MVLASPQIRVRKLIEADLESLYQLYLAQEKQIPYQPRTRFAQFAADLRTSRMYPDAGHYEPKAEIAIVAEVGGKVVAYANGCKANAICPSNSDQIAATKIRLAFGIVGWV